MEKDSLKVSGELYIELIGEDGSIKEKRNIKNLVVTVGKNWLVSALKTNTTSSFGYIAIGSGTTSPSTADTSLSTEIARATGTTTVVGNVFTNSITFGAGSGTGTLSEAGLFDAASVGNMFSRTSFTPIIKASIDILTIVWTITVN